MNKKQLLIGATTFILSTGLIAPMAFASPAPPLTSFTFFEGTSDGTGYVWDYYYPYGDPTAHVASQPMTGTTGYFGLFEDGYGIDSSIKLTYQGNQLNTFVAANDTPLTDSSGVVWGWIAYRGFSLSQVPQNQYDEFVTSCTSEVFPYNTYSDYVSVDVNPTTSAANSATSSVSTNPITSSASLANLTVPTTSVNKKAMVETYDLLTIAADFRLQRDGLTVSNQPSISYNQFDELLNSDRTVRSKLSTSTLPVSLVESVKLIGQKYGTDFGDHVSADLKKAYNLGLVDGNTRLLTNSELSQLSNVSSNSN